MPSVCHFGCRRQQTLRPGEERKKKNHFDYQIRSDWCDTLAVRNHIHLPAESKTNTQVFFILTLRIKLTNRDGFKGKKRVVNEWWIRDEGKHHKFWHSAVVCRMINSTVGWNLPLCVSLRHWLPLYLFHPARLHLQGSGGNQSLLLLPEVARCIYHH